MSIKQRRGHGRRGEEIESLYIIVVYKYICVWCLVGYDFCIRGTGAPDVPMPLLLGRRVDVLARHRIGCMRRAGRYKQLINLHKYAGEAKTSPSPSPSAASSIPTAAVHTH